ncbi:MAG: hypothetical protein KIT63_13405 [Rhodoferax sp.]|nr:hypothetical protein [Rhodoferax sp.]
MNDIDLHEWVRSAELRQVSMASRTLWLLIWLADTPVTTSELLVMTKATLAVVGAGLTELMAHSLVLPIGMLGSDPRFQALPFQGQTVPGPQRTDGDAAWLH